MRYQVFAKYDDGYESTKEFDNETSAKNFFYNIDVQDTEYVLLNACNDDGTITEIARKEPRKKATTQPAQ